MNPRLGLVCVGLLFSLGGTLIKACTFPSLERAGLRSLIAAATLFLLLPEARRRLDRRIGLLLLPYFGATVLFVVANTLTTAANAIFLQSTYPFWVAMLAPFVLHERLRARDALVLAAIAIGMGLFLAAEGTATAIAADPRLGDALAVVSGLAYGSLLIGLRWLSRADHGAACAVAAWGNLANVPLTLLLSAVVGQTWTAGDLQSWASILVLGTLQVGLAYAMLVRAMPLVPAVTASLILMIEPAVSPLLAWLVHGETPHGLALAGGSVILAAAFFGSLPARTKARSEPRESAR